ncbi:MAG: MCE family protein [Gammaproteobacteria bacterium]|nr:MCE family protein [Gammaproteobacteria bacterium]
MGNRIRNALVGMFVIIFGAAWVAVTLWLALGDLSIQYTTYRVYLDESVSGLYRDAPVKYRGVDVGKVTGIDLNPAVPDQVQLTLDVVSTTPIRVDTLAELAVQGLTGIAFVDLKGGSLESPMLVAKGGEEYPVISSSPSFFARLDTTSTELIASLNVMVNSLVKLMDADGRKSLKEIIANINTITTTVANRKQEIDHSLVNASRLLENGAAATERLVPLLAQLDETVQSFQVMADRVGEASGSLNRYVEGSGTGVQQFSQQTLPEVGALISELRTLADSLKGVSEKLEDDPRVLLYGTDLEAPGPGE